MEVIPAIDIKGGKCVQLFQGDYNKETIFSDDPVSTAVDWATQGVPRLHVVDLDGAKDGISTNLDLVGQIASTTSVPIQLGGGIRTLESACRVASVGVERIIIGTAAIENPTILPDLITELGEESIVVSIDARNDRVALSGWTQISTVETSELLKRIEAVGVRRFVYTDIARDGTLTEPNFEAIDEVRQNTPLRMVVAGGIALDSHLQRLSDLGVEGAIVGTAAYTGAVNIRKAVQQLGTASNRSN